MMGRNMHMAPGGASGVDNVKRGVITLFILFHLLAITCWSVPVNTLLIQRFRDLIAPYMRWSGLFQSWDTFAPEPKSFNAYVEAVVIMADGRTETWKFPRMERLGLLERYPKERYRKFAEVMPQDYNSGLWPDVARHIARLYGSAADPPRLVILIRYWSDIPAPSAAPKASQPKASAPLNAHIFFEYKVNPEDLK